MESYVGIIGIVVSVLMGLIVMLLTIIGYFGSQWMKSIKTDLACLPEIKTELAGMKVKVEQHSDKQDDFCEKQEQFSNRLMEVEKHISNTERIAVLERAVETLDREVNVNMRPHLHSIANYVSELSGTIQLLADAAKVKMPTRPVPALNGINK